MKDCRLILLLVSSVVLQCVVQTTSHDHPDEHDESDPFGYLVVSPKALFSGKEESICVTIKDADEPVEVTLTFMENNITEISRLPPFSVEFGTACSIVEVPTIDESPKTVILSVQMKRLSAAETELTDDKKVVIFKRGKETFVQTDKPIYKPGQTVMFRVLTLDGELKPDLSSVSDIWVETPSAIRVAQWLDQTSEDGLIDLELPMSSDPPLGDWKIVVVRDDEKIEKTFKVDEYVLPKFEIKITTPLYIVTNAKEFEVRICARYTYGQPVRGSFSADVSIDQGKIYWHFSQQSDPRPVLRFESADTGNTGCGTIIVGGEALRLNNSDYSVWSSRLKVDVNFTEEATGVTLSEMFVSESGIVTTDPLVMTLEGPSTFKPGMPFSVWLTVTYPDGTPAPGEEVKIIARKDYVEFFNQTFTSSDDGKVYVILVGIDINTNKINIFAEAQGYKNWKPYDPDSDDQYSYHYIYDPMAYLYAEASYSPSGSFVQIAPIEGELIPGTEQEITTYYTADPAMIADLQWFFVFVSRNEILTVPVPAVEDTSALRKKRTSEPVILPIAPPVPVAPPGFGGEEVNITQPGQLFSKKNKFTVDSKMSPVTKLLVYYILPDQEVVAHSIKFDVKPVFDNKVSIAFASREIAPGGKALLKLSASEGSLCAVGIVDKSVYVLEEAKDQITKDKVFDKIRGQEQYYNNYWTPSQSDHCPNEFPWWWYGAIDRRRRKRTSVPYGSGSRTYEDSSQAFKDMGLVFISNMRVETRPCNTGRYPVAVAYDEGSPNLAVASSDVSGGEGQQLAASVRSLFPETWLWKLFRIGENGEGEEDLDVPHTITDWVSNGVCVSAETGLGVADTSILRAFQPFFVSLTLPYSIIRGEEVTVKATVFNYLSDECIVVRVSLIESDKFDNVDNKDSKKGCVCAQTSETFEYVVKGLALGEIDIEVHVVSVADEEVLCGNEATLNKETGLSDAVRRKILVEPEGIQHEFSINKYFCPSELPFASYNKRFDLLTPPNIVEGSTRGRLTLTGDMMGQTISNLDGLLKIPMGCGEQNMVGFVPNIVVMQYFTESGTLTEDVKRKAETNMKRGYMRELNYRHKDGSYSAFGENDDSGSTWLTAYVVRSFAQAAKFISVDQMDLDITIDWLKERQNERGCFNAVGNLCHKAMAGGVNNEITLTAYIVTSMLIAGVEPEDPVIQGALECLEKEAESLYDTYAAAQLAGAMLLAGHPDASNVMDYLESVAVDKGEIKHWVSNRNDTSEYESYYRASKQAQEIEMTAHVLLAYTLYLTPQEARIAGSPIARWLISQRSSNGGFSSTQDTVIGLQALAAYAGILNSQPLKMRVELMERGRKIRQFELLEKNKLVMQEMELNVPNTYTIRARGKGCGLLQFTVFYNMLPQTPPIAPFSLTKRSRSLDNICSKFLINMCASYLGDGSANMVLTQVKLITGFAPDTTSINELKAQKLTSKLKRIETDGKLLSFYIDQGLDRTPLCWDFIATKEFDVKNAKPGTVNMFDYYEKDLAISDSLEFVCGPIDEDAGPGEADETPVEPEVGPSVGPEDTPSEGPEDTPSIGPEDTPSVGPEDTPSIAPEDTPSIAPEDTPSAAPEVTPSAAPEVTPSVKPTKPPAEIEVDPSAKPTKPPVKPVDDPSAKPTKPPVKPVVDPSAKPDKPPVDQDVATTATPDVPPVDQEVATTAKPDVPPVDQEVATTAKPDVPPVDQEVATTATPDVPPVDQEVATTAKPDVPPVDQEVATTATPDVPPVDQEVATTAKPDVPPVDQEVATTAKPDVPPVDLEVATTAKADVPPVDQEVATTAKPDVPPVDQEVATTAKPDVPPVDQDVATTATPDVPPVDQEVATTAKPDVPPVDQEVATTATPDVPPVDQEVATTATPDVPPVDQDVATTAKPDVPPVDQEVATTAKPDVPPVDQDVATTVTPDVPPVDQDVATTAKPDVPPVDQEVATTAKPDVPPVDQEVATTAKPDVPPVDQEVATTAKPDVLPVDQDVATTATPDVPPVDQEVATTAKPDVPPVDQDVATTAKPDVPPVDQEVATTATPDVPPVDQEVATTATPDVPPVDQEVATTATPDVPPTTTPSPTTVATTANPDVPPVDQEVATTPKPDVPPVDQEVATTAKPDVPPVDQDVATTATPDVPPVDQDVATTAKPDVPPVDQEVATTAKPDVPPVDQEVATTAKPDVPPVDQEVATTAKPDVPPVDQEVATTATPDVPPVDQEVATTAKPDVPPVDQDVATTATPDVPPVDQEVATTAKPDVPPVDQEVATTAKPDVPPVDQEVATTATPDVPPVDQEVATTATPDVPPVDQEVATTATPDVPPVDQEVATTATPDVPPVDQDVATTAKPDVPPVDQDVATTATPDVPPVDQDVATTATPDVPPVDQEVGTTTKPDIPPTTAPSPRTTAITTVHTPTTVTQTPTTTVIIADTYCDLFPDMCGNGVCVDDDTQPSSYRCDCDSGYEEGEGTCVDADECTIGNICLDPDKVCVNLPGTYECNCQDSYQEDSEGSCFACPICSSTFPSGFEEAYCNADYVYGAKIRNDGMLRILIELRQVENRISNTRYIDPVMNPQCTCHELTYGDRVLIVTSMDKVETVQLKRKTVETVDLGGAYIVPLKVITKHQLQTARSSCQ